MRDYLFSSHANARRSKLIVTPLPLAVKLTLGLGRSSSELVPPEVAWPYDHTAKTVVTDSTGDKLDGYYQMIWKRRGVDPDVVGVDA